MRNRIKNNFQHCRRRLKEGWRFRKYNYTQAERERFYKSPSDWIVHLFSSGGLTVDQSAAARHLAGVASGAKREWAEFIVGSLTSVANGERSHEDITARVAAKAESNDNDSRVCDYRFWLESQRVLGRLGFLQAAGRIRDLALDSLLGQAQDRAEYELEPLAIFQAALEAGDFATAHGLAKAAAGVIKGNEGSLLQPLVDLSSQKEPGSVADSESLLQAWEQPYRRFSELLQDKHVAIVGPSVTESDLSSEIDAFDVVVRCGFMGRNSLPPGAGEKTSVSFYAGHKVRELINRGEGHLLNSLELVLLKHRSDGLLLEQAGVIEKAIGFSLPASQAFFATHPMAIPQVVHDIVFSRPRNVKIFKVNFFLEPGYPSGYEIGRELRKDGAIATNCKVQDPEAKCESFACVHDPLAQFRFMKHAWKCGLIQGDQEFTDIIKLSDEEYLQKLDRVYGYNGILRSPS